MAKLDQVRAKLEGLWKMLAKFAGSMCWIFVTQYCIALCRLIPHDTL